MISFGPGMKTCYTHHDGSTQGTATKVGGGGGIADTPLLVGLLHRAGVAANKHDQFLLARVAATWELKFRSRLIPQPTSNVLHVPPTCATASLPRPQHQHIRCARAAVPSASPRLA